MRFLVMVKADKEWAASCSAPRGCNPVPRARGSATRARARRHRRSVRGNQGTHNRILDPASEFEGITHRATFPLQSLRIDGAAPFRSRFRAGFRILPRLRVRLNCELTFLTSSGSSSSHPVRTWIVRARMNAVADRQASRSAPHRRYPHARAQAAPRRPPSATRDPQNGRETGLGARFARRGVSQAGPPAGEVTFKASKASKNARIR